MQGWANKATFDMMLAITTDTQVKSMAKAHRLSPFPFTEMREAMLRKGITTVNGVDLTSDDLDDDSLDGVISYLEEIA